MTNPTLPWKYSRTKCWVGYRKWESLKILKDARKRGDILSALESGKRILFLHIPKTAGVSLIRAYEEFFADARHSPALSYKLLLGRRYQEFKTFAVVRNPWARLLSAYNFLVKGGLIETDREMGNVLAAECPSFMQFVKEWLPRNGACSYMHFVPQHEFVCGWGDRVIVDDIMKLEHLDSDWPTLATKLGLPVRPIGRMNASAAVEYRDFYDSESVDIVAEIYRKDCALFGYSFE